MSDLEGLNKRIKDFKNKQEPQKKSIKSWQYGQIFNIAIDLCANIFVGLLIGLYLDRYFNSKPFGLMICLIVSVLSAFRMIVKNK